MVVIILYSTLREKPASGPLLWSWPMLLVLSALGPFPRESHSYSFGNSSAFPIPSSPLIKMIHDLFYPIPSVTVGRNLTRDRPVHWKQTSQMQSEQTRDKAITGSKCMHPWFPVVSGGQLYPHHTPHPHGWDILSSVTQYRPISIWGSLTCNKSLSSYHDPFLPKTLISLPFIQ